MALRPSHDPRPPVQGPSPQSRPGGPWVRGAQHTQPSSSIISAPLSGPIFPGMALSDENDHQEQEGPVLLDERSAPNFRVAFGKLLSQSSSVEVAILRIRLAAVDLSGRELETVKRFRVLVAEANAQTVEEETYALTMDPLKRENLSRVLGLLRSGILEIRSAPLGGWSPDFSVFSGDCGPQSLLIGLHWFHRPFPHRGPAWAVRLGAEEARRAQARFGGLWKEAHDIGPAIRRLIERTAVRRPASSRLGLQP